MKYQVREKGLSLFFNNIFRINYLRNIWNDVLGFIESEVKPVEINNYKDKQYLKLLKLKIARNLIKFKSFLYRDNIKSLLYLYKVSYLASIFAEYVYFHDKKKIYLRRKDIHV